jgi:hypothetical protein
VGFAVMLTADQSMRYQQTLELGDLAVVVLNSNEALTLAAQTAEITNAINLAKPGTFVDLDVLEGGDDSAAYSV